MPLIESPSARPGARPKSRKRESLLAPMAQAVGRCLRDLALGAVQETLDEAVDRTSMRFLAYLCVGALGVTAFVFLLLGAVEGLKAASLPPSFAYAAASMAALIMGLILFWILRSKRKQ